MEKQPAVYMMSNCQGGVIYTGVTGNLVKRVHQHRTHAVVGFTERYKASRLVWYELHDDMANAILREKRIKKWKRAWKVKRIQAMNPKRNDLFEEIVG